MDNRKDSFDSNVAGRTLDLAKRSAVERLGGELLEGSDFEDETPEPEFQSDWTRPKDGPEGGLR